MKSLIISRFHLPVFIFIVLMSLAPVAWANTAFTKPFQILERAYNPATYQDSDPYIIRSGMLTGYNLSLIDDLIATKKAGGNQIVELRFGVGSVSFLSQMEQDGSVNKLKAAGVTTMTYNPEGGHTPADEFALRFTESEENPIMIFARWGETHGFNTVWSPLRRDADQTNASLLKKFYDAGIDGITLQEQQFIETSCPADRQSAVMATFQRHANALNLTLDIYLSQYEQHVQLMAGRCATPLNCQENNPGIYGRCDAFVDLIDPSIDTVAIWPSTGDLDLLTALRTGPHPSPQPSPTPKPGDFDTDGDTDFVDFKAFLQAFGTQNCHLNLSNSCRIDLFDFNGLLLSI